MAKYDNVGDVKRRRVPKSLVALIVGIVIFVIGIVLMKVTNTPSFGKRYSIEETLSGADIKDIKLDIGASRVTISQSADDDIHVKGEYLPNEVTVKNNSGRFELEEKSSWFNTGYVNIDGNDPVLDIQLPAKQYSYIDIDGGAGTMDISDLECDVLEMDFGVGKSVCRNIVCKSKADLDLGVGQTTFEDCQLGQTDIDCGVGEMSFTGKIIGDCDVDGGIGKITLNITGDRADYQIIEDGEKKYSDLFAKYKIKVDSGIGEIKVNIAE